MSLPYPKELPLCLLYYTSPKPCASCSTKPLNRQAPSSGGANSAAHPSSRPSSLAGSPTPTRPCANSAKPLPFTRWTARPKLSTNVLPNKPPLASSWCLTTPCTYSSPLTNRPAWSYSVASTACTCWTPPSPCLPNSATLGGVGAAVSQTRVRLRPSWRLPSTLPVAASCDKAVKSAFADCGIQPKVEPSRRWCVHAPSYHTVSLPCQSLVLLVDFLLSMLRSSRGLGLAVRASCLHILSLAYS